MKKYYERILDKKIERKLMGIGAVLIQGPKWCGKTTTGKNLSKSFIQLDNPKNRQQYQFIGDTDPEQLLIGETPRLIDEWQLIPNIWNTVRHCVDERQEFNQFILTGSSTPNDLPMGTHTGIGRIARITMRTMSLYESNDSNGQVSLKSCFEDKKIFGQNSLSLSDIAYLTCRGGWPQSIGLDKEISLNQTQKLCKSLIYDENKAIIDRKINKYKLNKFLKSFAKNITTQANYQNYKNDLLNDITNLSSPTIASYIDYLKRIFVIEDSPAWNPNIRSKIAIRTSDTRYFVDPSIGTSALGLGPNDLLQDLNTFGLFFENLAIRDLRIYAQALDGEVYHYRDKSNLECDAVIHLPNGKYGLIEIKLGGDNLINQGCETLLKLENKIDTNKMNKPAFKMVLVAIGDYAYQRDDGIYIVPIGCLKD